MEELFGDWWVPERGSPQWGRLRLEDDSYALELESNPFPLLEPGYEAPVVFGTSRGRPVTLLRGQETARPVGGNRPLPERLDFGEVVLGDRLRGWRSAAFREIEVTADHLSDFIGVSGLALESGPPRHGHAAHATSPRSSDTRVAAAAPATAQAGALARRRCTFRAHGRHHGSPSPNV